MRHPGRRHDGRQHRGRRARHDGGLLLSPTRTNRAGFGIIATGLKQCLSEADGADSLVTAAMEKLFLSLA